MTAVEMVGDERRVSDRRASLHVATPADRRGQLLNRSERAHAETWMVEVQCALDAALKRAGHTIAAQKMIDNELRELRAALNAARAASRTATGVISGEAS